MKRRWTIALAVLLILGTGAALTGCGGNKEDAGGGAGTGGGGTAETRLSQTYAKMMADGKYLMKYKTTTEINGTTQTAEITMAVDGGKTAMTVTGQGSNTTTILKEDKMYIIDHQTRTVMVMPVTNTSDLDASLENAVIGNPAFTTSGTENGLKYETYKTEGGEISYYFKGDQLVRIVSSYAGMKSTMEILEMTDKIPGGTFDVPSGYQVLSF